MSNPDVRVETKIRTIGGVFAVACLAAVTACGVIMESPADSNPNAYPDDTPIQPAVSSFECAPGAEAAWVPGRRLTKAEYSRTMRDLLSRYAVGDLPDLVDGLVQAALPSSDSIEAVPDAVPGATDFPNLYQDTTRFHNDVYFQTAKAVGASISAQYMGAVVGGCAVDGNASNDQSCVESFVRAFGKLTHRRQLREDEVRFFIDEVYAEDVDGQRNYTVRPVAISDVIATMLMSPFFLYHLPTQGEQLSADTFALDAYGLAARLSYHFWNTMPDDELFRAADAGELMTEQGYRTQVDRLFQDPRGRQAVRSFVRHWLDLDRIRDPSLSASDPVYRAFAGDDLPSGQLRDAAINEVLDSIDYYIDAGGTLANAFLSEKSFARDPQLAEIYGAEVWDGVSEPGPFGDEERRGLLMRAAFLIDNSPKTHPILRGVFIRKRILCDQLSPPPADVTRDDLEPLVGPTSNRQATEYLTGSGTCVGCHDEINGLGYPFEAFDALGRYRLEEDIFSETGTMMASFPVDTVSEPRIDSESHGLTVNDGSELTDVLQDSGYVAACLARNYQRLTLGRIEELSVDGCSLESLRTTAENASLKEFFLHTAMTDGFKQQRVMQ